MRRVARAARSCSRAAPARVAKGDKARRRRGATSRATTTSDDEDADEDDDDEERSSDEDDRPTKQRRSAEEDRQDDGLRQKQDLTGHDLGTNKKANEFEKDRFFVDKVDTDEDREGHARPGQPHVELVRLHESRRQATAPTASAPATSNAAFSRLFTELRLQTDFRHIGGGRWDARDRRARALRQHAATTTPATHDRSEPRPVRASTARTSTTSASCGSSATASAATSSSAASSSPISAAQDRRPAHRLRELARSSRCIGFGGLYPMRGSRSIDDRLRAAQGPTTARPAGRFVGAGGFGARVPHASTRTARSAASRWCRSRREQPRVSTCTSSGYCRNGAKLDFYHFALIDLVGSTRSTQA